jgi:FAD synthetase
MKSTKKVLVFGTFDRIHEGHIYFLKKAQMLGELYVSVASDESVLYRKNKLPVKKVAIRIKDVKELNIAKNVSMGDKTFNKWTPIKKWKPDIVAVGYDQNILVSVLKSEMKKIGHKFVIKKIGAFKPNKLHSSIINNK